MISEIYDSYRGLPAWVQLWVGLILVPVNSATVFFVFEPSGVWIAVLAIGAMLPNIPVMMIERGFSKTMALSHIIPWSVLVLWLIFARPEGSASYDIFLWILLLVDLVSLLFDFPDARKWLRGERDVAGSNEIR